MRRILRIALVCSGLYAGYLTTRKCRSSKKTRTRGNKLKTIDIYNLDVGTTISSVDKKQQQYATLTLTLAENYKEQILSLSHGTQRTENYVFSSTGIEKEFSYASPNYGKWVVTSTIELGGNGSAIESILAYATMQDEGVWDLCEILTFLTGRRVTTEEETRRYSHKSIGAHACAPHDVLILSGIAMNNRKSLIDKKLCEAFLLYNESLSQDSMVIVAGLVNSAFNVLLDHATDPVSPVPKKKRTDIKSEINKIIDASDLENEQKEAYKALIGSRVDQGTDSLVDKTKRLLLKLDIIQEPIEEDVMTRIKYINTLRNLSTHAGKVPKLKGLDEEQSLRYAGSIVTGVIPEICCMVFGEALGLYSNGSGYSGLFKKNLTTFFREGIWREWTLEVESFDEWFYQ